MCEIDFLHANLISQKGLYQCIVYNIHCIVQPCRVHIACKVCTDFVHCTMYRLSLSVQQEAKVD